MVDLIENDLPPEVRRQWCEGHRRKVDKVVTVHLPRTGAGPRTFMLCLECARELRNLGVLEPVFRYTGRTTAAGSRGATPPHVRPWDYELTLEYAHAVAPVSIGSGKRERVVIELLQCVVSLFRMLGYQIHKEVHYDDSESVDEVA